MLYILFALVFFTGTILGGIVTYNTLNKEFYSDEYSAKYCDWWVLYGQYKDTNTIPYQPYFNINATD